MLPTDDKSRKGLPVFRGPLMYFPDAMLALAAVCKVGNDQHNPGEPLRWAREKSTEQMDTALRHMMDHGTGNARDVDGTWHLAKAAWRILAELQLTIEKEAAANKAAFAACLERELGGALKNEYSATPPDVTEDMMRRTANECRIYGCSACTKAEELTDDKPLAPLDGRPRNEGMRW